jgi:exopolyphosphatase/guanosine-5'-triphosphate,3'-diphosphate pyrophosphatase
MYAAVDLGSNSFRLHIGEQAGAQMRVVKTARDPVRLAGGLDKDGNLAAAAIEKALASLRSFRAILKEYRLDGVRVVATNTLRVAGNAAEFLPLAEQAIGYPIEIISGEEEGRLIYMGVDHALALPGERRLVIDIGGGSTEVILGQGAEIQAVESFGIGTQPQSMTFFGDGGIDQASFDAAIMSARSRFEDAAGLFQRNDWNAAYGSSGTIRAIAAVIAKNEIGDGTLSLPSLVALQRMLVQLGHVDRFDLPGIKPDRVIVMVGGLAILIGIMQELGIEHITAINAGLRLGVLCDLEMRANSHDRRDQSILGCMRRFGVDEERAARTDAIASRVYDKLKPESDQLARYLAWSCQLHEVGQAVSHSGAHKHAAYIVENADLAGFTTREQRIMSTLVVGQKGNLRKIRAALADPDFAKAVLALRLAAMFMHARIDADLDEVKVRMKTRIDIEVRREWMKRHPTAVYLFEKEHEWWAEVDVDFAVQMV